MISKEFLKQFLGKVSKPLSFMEIAHKLALPAPERRRMKRLLRELTQEGLIVRTGRGLYCEAEQVSEVSGSFEAHKGGYGFVISEKPGERDIFIPARASLGAMNNDSVIARLENRQRREGRILRILERAQTRITGTFDSGRRGCFVIPKSRNIQCDFYIAPKDSGKAKDGDRVIAEIIHYPDEKRLPTGRVVRVLKKPESPADDIEGVIEELNLPEGFPKAVVAEAKRLYSHALKTDDRKDLRNLLTVTIDGESAKDFDDAVSIERSGKGFRLWVHIADVGHFVDWDSSIDIEARQRGTSIYFPDRVIPMLPEELSEDICSLKPGVDRLAFTVEMDFDESGKRLSSRFYPSIINSNERMTYTSVHAIVELHDETELRRYDYLVEKFELMKGLFDELKRGRIQRGSLDFDLPEPEVLLDIQGRPEAIIRSERNVAHMIIEEFMIAANEAVAEYLEGREIPILFRVHEEPDAAKLDELFAAFKLPGLTSGAGRDFCGILSRAQGTPQEEIINHIVLRSLKQAKYSPHNIGHFGLASGSYCHFTSPIRRYPDLVVHRILREALKEGGLDGARISELEEMLTDIAFHSSKMERLADDAERAVLDIMRVWFMKDRVGEEFDGKVTAVTPHGLKVRFKDYFVEGFLHVSAMTDDYYEYDAKGFVLKGLKKKKRYSIASEIRVRIDRVDLEDREIVLGI